MTTLAISPSAPLRGTLTLPGDKSISHRAVIFGSIADGATIVENLLEAEDLFSTIEAMRSLGVKIQKIGKGKWRIEGVGIGGLRRPRKVLYCGNSGTTLRLLTGLLAGAAIPATLTGDPSLNARPMNRVIEPLRAMGAKIEERRTRRGRLIRICGRPLSVGARHAVPLHFRIPVASAQVKSALLLAGLAAGKRVVISEPLKSRDHSERMLKALGAEIKVRGNEVRLEVGAQQAVPLHGRKITVPADFSSAAFFLVAALISPDPGTSVLLKNVGMNPTRTGALAVLKKMGGRIRVVRRRWVTGEPVADLVALPSRLKGVRVSREFIPSLIDEVPILSVAAACAKGKTLVRGAGELRVKETDRIRAIATELSKFGVWVKELPDGLEIHGVGAQQRAPLRGTGVKSYGDHRMAMSLAILGTAASGESTIEDCDCIATSLPEFVRLLRKLGGRICEKTL